jgi:hypothetical protein
MFRGNQRKYCENEDVDAPRSTYVMATSRPVAANACNAAWTPPAPPAFKWACVPIPSMSLVPELMRPTRLTSPLTLALTLSRLYGQ